MARSVNHPTPSEFSFGRGARPSLDLYPQPDPDFDPLALKRAQMQVDNLDPAAPLDWDGSYVGVDQYGRPLPTMQERGFTPIVREVGRGEADDVLVPTDPKAYEDLNGRGQDPNQDWRNAQVSDPLRVGWENGQYDPEVNAKTAAYGQGKGEQAKLMSAVTEVRDTKLKKIKRTPASKKPFNKDGELDQRWENKR